MRGGESLSGLAQMLWGDASLWFKLAQANGLSGPDAVLTAGQQLNVPPGVMRSSYTAWTGSPYDTADAIGDTSPNTPYPQPRARAGNKCGAFGQILLAAVAVAVSVALPGGGTVLSGALNAAVGSVASQGLGLATGLQDKFSFKGVALAAIAGGVSGGIGELARGSGSLARTAQALNGPGFTAGVARGVVANVATQGIALATGLQSRFDFAGVAVAGVAGGVGNRAATALGGGSGFGTQLGASAASALAAAATRSVLTGTSFGDNVLAVLPDVIGGAVGRAVRGGPKLAVDPSALGGDEVTGGNQIGAGAAGSGAAFDSAVAMDSIGSLTPQPGDVVVTARRQRTAAQAASVSDLVGGRPYGPVRMEFVNGELVVSARRFAQADLGGYDVGSWERANWNISAQFAGSRCRPTCSTRRSAAASTRYCRSIPVTVGRIGSGRAGRKGSRCAGSRPMPTSSVPSWQRPNI
ncbi:MAG: hypothetical protein V4537_01810 [Pseudomonadota bacterium]